MSWPLPAVLFRANSRCCHPDVQATRRRSPEEGVASETRLSGAEGAAGGRASAPHSGAGERLSLWWRLFEPRFVFGSLCLCCIILDPLLFKRVKGNCHLTVAESFHSQKSPSTLWCNCCVFAFYRWLFWNDVVGWKFSTFFERIHSILGSDAIIYAPILCSTQKNLTRGHRPSLWRHRTECRHPVWLPFPVLRSKRSTPPGLHLRKYP